MEDDWNGISCKLQELDADGNIVNEWEETDVAAVGEESGKSKFKFTISGLPQSVELPAGHQYVLRPVFKTSQNGGEDIYMNEVFYPIQIIEPNAVNDQEAKDKIKITSNPDGVFINLSDDIREGDMRVFNLEGKLLFQGIVGQGKTLIERSEFPTTGIYVVSVMTTKYRRVEKVHVAPH